MVEGFVPVLAEGNVRTGPVLDGDRVTWGESQLGDVAVLSCVPGTEPVERVRLPRGDTSRGFAGLADVLAASPAHLAFITESHDPVGDDDGTPTVVATNTLWLDGLPVPGGGERLAPTAVAVDGATLARAETVIATGESEPDLQRVIVRDGSGERTIAAGRGPNTIRHLRVAGSFVAWSLDLPGSGGLAHEVRVADHRTDRDVLCLRRNPARGFAGVDVQPDGTVAVVVHERDFFAPSRVGWVRPGRGPLRFVTERAEPGRVAIAGDRIAYVDPGPGPAGDDPRLVVVGLDGSVCERVRPAPGRKLGAFDWDGRRLTWSEFDPAPPGRDGAARCRIHLIDVP